MFSVRKSFHQKNRLLFGKKQITDITVPVKKKGLYQQKINEVEIREDLPWRGKLWRSIELNYHKTPYFSAYKNEIEALLVHSQGNLAEQNIKLIKTISSLLGIKTDFLRSSELNSQGVRSEHVKNLLHEVHADSFYQAHGAFSYMKEDGVFPLQDIPVYFQDAIPVPYRQYNNGIDQFVPYLSVLDALFNIGAEATSSLASSMTKRWLTWNEMTGRALSAGGGQ